MNDLCKFCYGLNMFQYTIHIVLLWLPPPPSRLPPPAPRRSSIRTRRPPKRRPRFLPSSRRRILPPLLPPRRRRSFRGSKLERWCAESPDSCGSGSYRPSFRDVVASSHALCAAPAATGGSGLASHKSCAASAAAGGRGPVRADAGSSSTVPAAATSRPPATSWAPRIVLLRRDQPRRGGAVFSSGVARPDQEGWHKALSRGARRRLSRASRPPRRPIPADLVGRCFNCFSLTHCGSLPLEDLLFPLPIPGPPILRVPSGDQPRERSSSFGSCSRLGVATGISGQRNFECYCPATIPSGGCGWWRSSTCLRVVMDISGQRGYRCYSGQRSCPPPPARASSAGCG
jgi:hypothetical protein